jgi:hypothetical protein
VTGLARLIGLVALGLLGCRSTVDATEVLLIVDSDLEAGAGQLSCVHIEVSSLPMGGALGTVASRTDTRVSSRADLPLVVGVAASDGADGFRAVLSGFRDRNCVEWLLGRTTDVRFVSGHVMTLAFDLPAACAGVRCPCGQSCDATGACATIATSTAALRPFVPDAGQIRMDPSTGFYGGGDPLDGGIGVAPFDGDTTAPACP